MPFTIKQVSSAISLKKGKRYKWRVFLSLHNLLLIGKDSYWLFSIYFWNFWFWIFFSLFSPRNILTLKMKTSYANCGNLYLKVTTAQPHNNSNSANCCGPEDAQEPWVHTEQLFCAPSGVQTTNNVKNLHLYKIQQVYCLTLVSPNRPWIYSDLAKEVQCRAAPKQYCSHNDQRLFPESVG